MPAIMPDTAKARILSATTGTPDAAARSGLLRIMKNAGRKRRPRKTSLTIAEPTRNAVMIRSCIGGDPPARTGGRMPVEPPVQPGATRISTCIDRLNESVAMVK